MIASVRSFLPSQASSTATSPQLIRLLPPLGCPGESVWVPPVEVPRWEQQGYRRAPIPAAPLELAWLPEWGCTLTCSAPKSFLSRSRARSSTLSTNSQPP